jgi:hypothetical protein
MAALEDLQPKNIPATIRTSGCCCKFSDEDKDYGDIMRVTGRDTNGIPRVYGEGENADVAETDALREAKEYVRRRPETGPLSAWTFSDE